MVIVALLPSGDWCVLDKDCNKIEILYFDNDHLGVIKSTGVFDRTKAKNIVTLHAALDQDENVLIADEPIDILRGARQ